MVQLIENRYGTDKSIPQLILAGASCDDVFVIVLFTTFVSMAQGGEIHAVDFINIPVSILLSLFFETAYGRGHSVRNGVKVIVVLGTSFLLIAMENWLEEIIPDSGLLAVDIRYTMGAGVAAVGMIFFFYSHANS